MVIAPFSIYFLDFPVEESGVSDAEDVAWGVEDEWLAGQTAPLNLLTSRCGAHALHLALGDLIPALLNSGRFTVRISFCRERWTKITIN